MRSLYEHFGPHRLCRRSDYPVVGPDMTYTSALEIVRTHSSWLPETDRDWIRVRTLQQVIATRRPLAAS